jgi:hypothetical protein
MRRAAINVKEAGGKPTNTHLTGRETSYKYYNLHREGSLKLKVNKEKSRGSRSTESMLLSNPLNLSIFWQDIFHHLL